MSEENKQTVLRFIHAMSDGDAATADACLGPDAVAITKGFSKFTGDAPREVIVQMIGMIKDLVPTGLGITVNRLIAEGDAVAAEFVGNATTRDGTKYANQYCMIFTLKDGKIALTHEYFCTKLAEDVLWPIVSAAGLAGVAGNG
jgi:ketosteroid isomerase-like protein